ncbi:MAG: protein-glutamate O-methyltransferase CheR [Alphaproteobacteria bacterium]|nr:protein-glutamate O-methyltransferase CheR [Alphaproteobacteria bacterium]
MKRQDFEFLIGLLKDQAGWEFDEEQYFIVDKKISGFIREKGYSSIEELISELKMGNKPLIAQVVENMVFSDTSFYRDFDVFDRFENALLPSLRENNRASKKLRFWSLGCSSGQETYSIAFAVKRKFIGIDNWDISILGTDISSVAIAKAQRGIYNNFEVQMGLNAKMILDFFHQISGQWQVNDEISKMVEFRRYNMLDAVTFTSQYEVIFCRNVLRYFTKDNQELILERLSSCQRQGGILYLGKNEHIQGIERYYNKLSGYTGVYICKGNLAEKPRLSIGFDQTSVPTEMPRFVRPDLMSNK